MSTKAVDAEDEDEQQSFIVLNRTMPRGPFSNETTTNVGDQPAGGSVLPSPAEAVAGATLTPIFCPSPSIRSVSDRPNEKIVINVGGQLHETLLSTLLRKPKTRLWRLAKEHIRRRRNNETRFGQEEYFFDRHPGVFATVIDYYRTDELHVPLDMCGAVAKRELGYWQVDDCLIKACCWTNYSSYLDNLKALSEFKDSRERETKDTEVLSTLSGWRKKQMELWMILDHPRSSKLAMAYAVTSFAFVMASICGFCMETVSYMYTEQNVTRQCWWDATEKFSVIWVSRPALQNLDYLCTAFFTSELTLRLFVAPDKRLYFRNVMNIIDILALLPLYVQITLDIVDEHNCVKNSKAVIELIFVLRIVRIFRIFHLVRHYRALQILVQAISASIQELLMLFIFLLIGTLVFSTLIFYAERKGSFKSNDGHFENIPVGFWWSIITMTTVGYGDIYPITPMGRFIGATCAVCGVLLVALTIPVISNNFALFYVHVRTRDNIEKKKETLAADRCDLEQKPTEEDDIESVDDDAGFVSFSKCNGNKANNDSFLICPLADLDSTTMTLNDDDNYDDYDFKNDTSPKSLCVHLVNDSGATDCSAHHKSYHIM